MYHYHIYHNPSASTWTTKPNLDPAILPFHKSLPNYNQTPLHRLPTSLSKSLNLGPIFLKDESHRFGLPAYKILGASWACYRAVIDLLDLPPNLSIDEVREAVKGKNVTFYTATDGNWGRAVARMGLMLGAQAKIYVPKVMVESTKNKIRQEGAEVVVVDGEYDLAVKEAERISIETGGLLISDTAWPGYEKIPQYVVSGYTTMMHEITHEIPTPPDLIVVPIGVGSLGQATVTHFKSSPSSTTKILSVEPTTAACLHTSLLNSHPTTVPTQDTSMCGMNCGTVSSLAWPILRSGVDASITVIDDETHTALTTLIEMGINVGPCAAATLAALVKACKEGGELLGLSEQSVVVLLGTEAPRGEGRDES